MIAAQDFGIEQDPGFLGIAPLQDFIDLLKRNIARNIGEEAEPALIYAHQRNLVFGEPAGTIEQRAVAPKHHGQIGVHADLLVAGNRKTGRQSG